MTQLIGTCLMFALWQSTLILAAALLVGRCFRKTPWQSHDLHLFGIVAAVLAPMFSTAIAVQNAGWFANGRWSDVFLPLANWSNVFGVLLLVGMILFVALLIWGIVASRKLMFRAKPFPDRESQEALLRSAETLQNVSLPILFTSQNVKSPTVWCWGLHPAVVLPEALAESIPAEERDAIFLHELAHITRRDHLTALLTRICGIFLFWNPLYWLALRQADLLADEACDLLVLSRGNVSPETYTETLLRLAAGECYKPAFQFLSRKEKIMKRIITILDFGDLPTKPSVNPSRLWQCSALVVALLLCVTLAFCQGRKDSPIMFDGFAIYDVNKSVAEFEDNDLSSPEAAYATFNKILASKDKDIIAKLKEYDAKRTMLTEREINTIVNVPDDLCEQLKTAEILKVSIFHDKKAIVIAKHGAGNTQKPYHVRKLEKVNDQWFNAGDDRAETPDEALMKFSSSMTFEARIEAQQRIKTSEEVTTSLKAFFSKELLESKSLKWYPVKKRIVDFPADDFDLSTPEKSYATQKNLIVSLKDNKWELFSKMQLGHPPIQEHERRGESGLTEEWAQTYREEFVIFEAFVLNDKYAFVFGLREFDQLYDGNYFMKQNDQWLNMGNDQAMDAREIAERVEKTFGRRAKVLQELEEKLGSMPDTPQVIKMEPANGADDVDPDTVTELRVTFDRDMDTSSYAWCGLPGLFPERRGKEAKWIDKRTCIAPVKLEPGRQYEFMINSAENRDFKSAEGIPVVPVTFTFSTKPAAENKDNNTPKITKTEPANGAEDVDPDAVTELRVTFDRDMNTDGYSWCGGGETYPETTDSPKWFDKRTCVLPVKLQPGKDYILGINARDFRNFKSAEGVPVVPVVYTFKTKQLVRSADDPQATIFDKLPQFPNITEAAKPLPDELVRKIAEKRKSLQSAEYTVTFHRGPKNITTNSALFRFQNDKQWYVDISDMMKGPPVFDRYEEMIFMTGCDGEKEWCYSTLIFKDEELKSHNHESCKERTLASIKEINTSFLDPFDCLNTATDEIGKHLNDRGIVYLGEVSIEGKSVQLFGTTFESIFGNEKMQNDIMFAFDMKTLLPCYTLHFSETKSFGKNVSVYFYDIAKVNQGFVAEDFRPKLPEHVKPELVAKPEEGYEYFFVRVRDGADGRASVRAGGQQGEKGSMSGGLN